MAASSCSGTTASKFSQFLLVDQLYAKEVHLCICDNIQSSMHQIFTDMYLTVSIELSYMESPTELFIRKFLFQWSPHFSAFDSQQKSPQTGTCYFISTTRDTWTQSLITSFLNFKLLSTSQVTITGKIYWSLQARFLIACSNFKS